MLISLREHCQNMPNALRMFSVGWMSSSFLTRKFLDCGSCSYLKHILTYMFSISHNNTRHSKIYLSLLIGVFLLTIFRHPIWRCTQFLLYKCFLFLQRRMKVRTETQCKPTSSVTLGAEQTTKALVSGVLLFHVLTHC